MTDDKQAKIDAIKARLAKMKEGGGSSAPKAGGGAEKAASGAGGDAKPAGDGGDDVKARIAALKAKMEAGKGAEKKAAALPPKLTVPMIVFFLPVLFAVIITPAAIQIIAQ